MALGAVLDEQRPDASFEEVQLLLSIFGCSVGARNRTKNQQNSEELRETLAGLKHQECSGEGEDRLQVEPRSGQRCQ